MSLQGFWCIGHLICETSSVMRTAVETDTPIVISDSWEWLEETSPALLALQKQKLCITSFLYHALCTSAFALLLFSTLLIVPLFPLIMYRTLLNVDLLSEFLSILIIGSLRDWVQLFNCLHNDYTLSWTAIEVESSTYDQTKQLVIEVALSDVWLAICY